jgi:hypothetical protein
VADAESDNIVGQALAVAAPSRRTTWDPGDRPTMDDPALLVLPAAVHQAEGALVACLGVPIEEAAELLRAQARDHGMTVEDMADEVLAPLPGLRRNGHHARQHDR